MAKKAFLAFACCVLSVHAFAWGQTPAYGPYGPNVGVWPEAGNGGGPGVVPVSYQPPPWMMAAPAQNGYGSAQPSMARTGGAPTGILQTSYFQQDGQPMMQPGPMEMGPGRQPVGDGSDGMGGPCPCNCGDGCGSIPGWQAFGDFLYMRPRDANVPYGVLFSTATQTNVPPSGVPGGEPPIQLAQPGVASIDYHPGFRVGFAKSLDECNAVVATFSHFDAEDHNSITSPGAPGLIRSMVSQPATWVSNDLSDWTSAASDYQMVNTTVDVDLRWTFENDCDTRLSLIGGARYTSLDQRLDVLGNTAGGGANLALADVQDVHTQINFEGAGLRAGVEGERRTPWGLVFYGRTVASVVGGTFRCAYTQTSGLFGPQVVTGYPADRVVPIIDAEVGTGISLLNDRLRVTSGYCFSGWFNVVRTQDLIGAVQTNNFSGMGNTLTFDGFVGRVELNF